MSDVVDQVLWAMKHGDRADMVMALGAAAGEIAMLRCELARPLPGGDVVGGGVKLLPVRRGRGVYSGWGLETGLLVSNDD